MEQWKKRLGELLEKEKDDLVTSMNKAVADGVVLAAYDPARRISQDLQCEAVESTPLPYILNVGCGFTPTSVGWRTQQGNPVTVVGVDPLAHAINETLNIMSLAHEAMMKSRRFVMPVVGEEMNVAIPPGSFHAVWSDGAILDALDPFRFLQQCVRASKQSGVVCVRLGQQTEDRLWKVLGYDGARLVLESAIGTQQITEIRGERIEVHTMLDETLMIKIRRPAHSQADVEKRLVGMVRPSIVLK